MSSSFKKKILIIIQFVLILLMMPITQADFGPKRTTQVYITGINEPYEFDILMYQSTPVNTIDLTAHDYLVDYYYLPDYGIEPLNGFQDSDGFVSYTLYNSAPATIIDHGSTDGTRHFTLGYFSPPRTFKIAIYTKSGQLIISEDITTPTFYSRVTYDLSGVSLTTNQTDVGIIERGNVTGYVIADFAIRLVLTLLIELGVFALFGYRQKKSYLKIGLVNGITQITLTLFVVLAYYFWGASLGAILILIFGEAIVFLIEGITYPLILKEKSKKLAVFYALTANALSFMIMLLSIALFLYP